VENQKRSCEESLKLAQERVKEQDKVMELLIKATKIMPIKDDVKRINRLFEEVSSNLSCLAMALTSWKNRSDFPEKTISKAPQDWNGWNTEAWDSIRGYNGFDSLLIINDKKIINEEKPSIYAVPIPIFLHSQDDEEESNPDEILLFIIQNLDGFSELNLLARYLRMIGAQFYMARRIQFQSDTQKQTLNALTRALDSRDSYTRGHSERVARYAETIARTMWKHFPDFLTSEEKSLKEKLFVDNCRLAGLLHDVGKIGIGDFQKEDRKLSDEEFLEMKCHVRESARILSQIESFRERGIDKAALHHHERIDNRGYLGIDEKEVSACAKIITIADSYDAMTSDRSYREKISWDVALDDLRVNSVLAAGKEQYAPELFQAFEWAIAYAKKPKGLCPGYRNQRDAKKIRLLKAAVLTLKRGNKEEYRKKLENAQLKYYDAKLPGLKVLERKLFRNELKNLDRYAPNSSKTFSIGIIKWADQNGLQKRIANINKCMRNFGERHFKLSRYKDAFVIFSETLPDRDVYNALMSFPKGSNGNRNGDQPYGVVTLLDQEPDPIGKFKRCYDGLNECIAKEIAGSTKTAKTIQFWRDMR